MPFNPHARPLVAVLAVVAMGACTHAVSRPAPPAVPVTVDPTGEYDITFTDDGSARSATMVVRGVPGEFTGQVNAENRPPVAISAMAASGSQVIITGNIPQGVMLIRFRLTGDSLRGDWALRGDGGKLTGVKRPRAHQ
jgi:hypothetical protein